MTRAEDRANKRITKKFIGSQPTDVNLVPYTKVDDEAGSWRYLAGQPRKCQTVRLIDPYTPAPIQKTIDGMERVVTVELMAESCAVLALHDRFTHDGIDYEVTSMWNNTWGAKRAWVVRRG